MEIESFENTYLVFSLEKDLFSVNVFQVSEILEVPEITKVPQAPKYMLGVINVRGTVLPLVDTRKKFGFQSKEIDLDSSIIILEIKLNSGETVSVGALVDKVVDVLEVDVKDIQAAPTMGIKYKPEFIKGMLRMAESKLAMILEVDKVFSTEDLILMSESSEKEL